MKKIEGKKEKKSHLHVRIQYALLGYLDTCKDISLTVLIWGHAQTHLKTFRRIWVWIIPAQIQYYDIQIEDQLRWSWYTLFKL